MSWSAPRSHSPQPLGGGGGGVGGVVGVGGGGVDYLKWKRRISRPRRNAATMTNGKRQHQSTIE